MKQADIKIGAVYQVKVSGQLKPVRVEFYHPPMKYQNGGTIRRGGYEGLVLTTGRKITITAGRIRKELPQPVDGKSAAANDIS